MKIVIGIAVLWMIAAVVALWPRHKEGLNALSTSEKEDGHGSKTGR